MTSSTEKPKEYPKRPGTSGIRGHLYETKLLSLIYFRAIHDDKIEEFHLATNVDKLGSFDDICFRAKVREFDKPITVFLQAKHRENNSVLTLNSRSDLAEYYNSYLEIRRKFHPNNSDVLFRGSFNETECLFVIYTTAKGDKNTRAYKGNYLEQLNALIGTRGPCVQPLQGEQVGQIILEEQMTALARPIAKCIFGDFNDSQMLMQDELVLIYHVILAQKVFDVSHDQSEGYRVASFRQDFFDINEEFLQLFKDELCTEIFKRRKFVSSIFARLRNCFARCFLTASEYEYWYIKIANRITYKNRKFEFLDKMESEQYRPFLNKINESQKTIRKTIELVVKECIPSLEFKVPASFGNKDLTIKGGDKRIERKLDELKSRIIRLIDQSSPSNIVIIDESLGQGFLQLSGGIASTVGNLLVFDDFSKLMKFNDNYESLGKLAKSLFDKLKGEMENLYEYKFDVQVKIFPKLTLDIDEYTKKIVSDFSDRLLFYTSQSKEKEVETTLIDEIKRSLCDDVQTGKMKSSTIFLKYHDEVQKWWMTPKVGNYLTKEGSLYKNSVNHTSSQPMISAINMMQRINNKNYTFTESAVNSIKLDQPPGTVIVTKNCALTIAKFKNHLDNKDCVILNLESILNFSVRDINTLRTELTNTNEEKNLIVFCDKALLTKSSNEKIENIANSIRDKIAITIINDQNLNKNLIKYFSLENNVTKDERNNLIDMSKESQKSILENTKVIFQRAEVTLNEVLDDESIGFVGEDVLCKLMQGDTIIIGKPACHLNYKETLYIKRTVTSFKVIIQSVDTKERSVEEGISKPISTLYDIEDDIVLINGDPGMGKSTLLTHLSLKTKELDQTVWILRINLLEFSRQFFEWQDNKTVIDTFESLKFLCRVALSEENSKNDDVEIALREFNGIFYLEDCTGDEWTAFELKLFLHHYNTKKLIILFDGFDEICPTYACEVLSLIKAVKQSLRRQKRKIWMTSRSYDKIITCLELKYFYKLEPLNDDEQDIYLTTFWDEKKILENLDDDQIRNNIYDFSMFMSQSDDIQMFKKKGHLSIQSIKEIPILGVYLSLVKYLKPRLKPLGLKKLYKEPPTLQFSGFVATPLHLNMLANHLYNQIRETNANNKKIPNKWDLDINIFEIYERFLETKLKKIRFHEKNQIDMFKPDNIEHYKKEYADTKEKLKKLAAYVVYDKCLLDKHQIKQCKETIRKLIEEADRTGIICNIVDNIPIFVHSTFAEYFAVEYICDLLKSQRNLKNTFSFILNVMFFELNKNVLVILDAKIKVDKELTIIMEKSKEIIFSLLLEQRKSAGRRLSHFYGLDTGPVNRFQSRTCCTCFNCNLKTANIKHGHGHIKSSLCEAIRLDLRNLGNCLLLTIEDNLNQENLTDFIAIVKETNILIMAVKMGFDESIITIINHVRMINESRLSELFENYKNFGENENYAKIGTDELVQKLHANVWMRMDIVPDWENLEELCGLIYFI